MLTESPVTGRGPLPARVTTFVTPLSRATTWADASGAQSSACGGAEAMDPSSRDAAAAGISDILVGRHTVDRSRVCVGKWDADTEAEAEAEADEGGGG